MNYHFTSDTLAKIKKENNTVGQDVRKIVFSEIVEGNTNFKGLLMKQSIKTKITFQFNSF